MYLLRNWCCLDIPLASRRPRNTSIQAERSDRSSSSLKVRLGGITASEHLREPTCRRPGRPTSKSRLRYPQRLHCFSARCAIFASHLRRDFSGDIISIIKSNVGFATKARQMQNGNAHVMLLGLHTPPTKPINQLQELHRRSAIIILAILCIHRCPYIGVPNSDAQILQTC